MTDEELLNFTADKARAMTAYDKKELVRILESIRSKAKSGEFKIHELSLSDCVNEKLKEMGYSVILIGGVYIISWRYE